MGSNASFCVDLACCSGFPHNQNRCVRLIRRSAPGTKRTGSDLEVVRMRRTLTALMLQDGLNAENQFHYVVHCCVTKKDDFFFIFSEM